MALRVLPGPLRAGGHPFPVAGAAVLGNTLRVRVKLETLPPPLGPAPPGQPPSVPTAVGGDLVAGARDAGGGSRGIAGITRVGVSRALPGRTLCPSPSPDTDIDAALTWSPGPPNTIPCPGLRHGLDGLKLAGGVTQQEAASLMDHVDGRGLGPGGHRAPSSGRSVCPDATFVEGVLSAASSCPEKP